MFFKNAILPSALQLSFSLWASAPKIQAPAPHRLQGILEVDPDSGAASLCFPLGPGIGRPGLQYVPALLGRFAPQISPTSAGLVEHESQPVVPVFELSPGSLEWPLTADTGTDFSKEIRWTYPDGTRGRAQALDLGLTDATDLFARFEYPLAGEDPDVLWSARFAGVAGECLLVPFGASRPERYSAPFAADGILVHRPGRLASFVLVVRSDLAYEYSFADTSRCGRSARYRLTGIRAGSGDRMTFTYGVNGLDFEVAWSDERLRLAVEGVDAAAPVPALDRGPQAPDSEISCAFEARLRIRYEGSLAGTPGYLVGLLLKADYPALGVATGAPFPNETAGHGGIPPSFPEPLQVSRLLAESSGESVEFTYAKEPVPDGGPSLQGARGSPTIMRSIVFPGKSFLLDWEPVEGEEPVPVLGIRAIHEANAPTYWRRPAPSIQPGCTVPGDEAYCAIPGWTRQSRHFAFAKTGGDPGRVCATYVRDRRRLKSTPGESDSDEGGWDCPTYSREVAGGGLVPVPGCLTRRFDWAPGSATPPDLHSAGRGPRIPEGLRGGSPDSDPGGTVRFKPPTYDPSRHEVTMEVVAGGPPLPNGPTPFRGQLSLDPSTGELKPWKPQTAEGILQRSIEDSSRPIPIPGHETLVAGQEAQAEFYHRLAMAQMAPGAGPMMPSAPHDPALGLDILAHGGIAGTFSAPSLGGVQTLQGIDETLGRAGEVQGRTAEIQRQSDESLRKLLDARRAKRMEAQRRAAEAGVDLDVLTRELRGPEEPAPAEGGGVLIKAWGAIRKAGESISEFIQRNSNQSMGLGRITDEEVPAAMEKLALTDPRKYNRIIFLWKIMDLPLISCGGLSPVGSGSARRIDIGGGRYVPDPAIELGTAGEPSLLNRALERAQPIPGSDHPNQLMAIFEDGTRVVFRKDFGADAHTLGRAFKGKGMIDHYNIEIHIPTPSGKNIQIEDVHIVPDGKGGYTWWGRSKCPKN